MKLLFCVFLVALAKHSSTTVAFDFDVIELTDDNFAEVVLQSDEVWLVDFYVPWCEYNSLHFLAYSKVARALNGNVRIAAMDADKYPTYANQYEVEGYPAIFIFADKTQPYKSTGSTVIGIIYEVIKVVNNHLETICLKENLVGNSTNSK